MPIYEYRCQRGHTFEVMQRMTDDPVAACSTCEAPVQRIFHRGGPLQGLRLQHRLRQEGCVRLDWRRLGVVDRREEGFGLEAGLEEGQLVLVVIIVRLVQVEVGLTSRLLEAAQPSRSRGPRRSVCVNLVAHSATRCTLTTRRASADDRGQPPGAAGLAAGAQDRLPFMCREPTRGAMRPAGGRAGRTGCAADPRRPHASGAPPTVNGRRRHA